MDELLNKVGSLNQKKGELTAEFNLSIKDLDRQIETAYSEIKKLTYTDDLPFFKERTLEDIMISAQIKSIANKVYDRRWSMPRKSEFVLRENNRCMASREVIDRIINLEGGIITDDSPTVKQFNDSVGAKSKKNDGFIRFKSYGTILYGLVEWLDPNNPSCPKEEYQ